MSGVLAGSLFYTSLDNNGELAPGSTLTFYKSGTTTPTTVYLDAGLAVPASNPVVTDANGRCVLYLDPTVALKVVIATASGIGIETIDPVNAVAPASNVFSVTTYGTKGDGNADDTAAIQSAIAAASVSGGIVYFPPGTYKISSALSVATSNVILQGAGRLLSIISASNATQDLIDISGNTENSVYDLGLTASVTKTAGSAIQIAGAVGADNGQSHFARLTITGSQYKGLNFTAARIFWVEDCVFTDCQQFSIGVQSPATYGTGVIRHNYCLAQTTATPVLGHIYQHTGGGLQIIENQLILVAGASTSGINIDGGSLGWVDGNVINGSVAASGTGIIIASGAATIRVGPNNTYQNQANLAARVSNASTTSVLEGEWINPAFAAGNYVGNGSQTWTVTSGEQTTLQYQRTEPKTLTVVFDVSLTTVGGAANTDLRITIPGGFTAAATVANAFVYFDNNTMGIGQAEVDSGTTYIRLLKQAYANWSASTNLTSVYGIITFPIQ